MKKIFFSLVMALVLVSCSTEELSNGGGKGSQKGIRLVLSTDDLHDVSSRAVDEDVVHDLNILEYIHGAIAQVVYLDKDNGVDFSKAVEVYGLKDFSATTLDNKAGDTGNTIAQNGIENFIFVVANYGSQINREDVSSLSDLKAFKMNFTGKDITNLPMTGFYYDGIDASSTTEIHVSLQRAVAKVNFTVDASSFMTGGQKPSSVSVDSIKLCNVPGQVTLYPCEDRPSLPTASGTTVAWSGTPFPTTAEMEAEGGSVIYGDEQNQSSTANTYVAYIPENARGSYTAITKNTDKRPSKCDASISEDDEKDKDKSYTHFRVVLKYVDPSDGKTKKATCRFYLGGNSTGDMNLLRNTEYTVATNIHGVNTADTRITVEELGPVADVMTENANCYMIDMSDVQSGSDKNVIIPLQQVINGWKYINSSTASNVQKILKDGNWEIKTEWRTWKDSNITGTKSSDFSADNLKATLTIPSTVTNGNNAVVKLVSGSTTYWSWHLWFTDYKPDESTDAKRHGQIHKYTSSQTKYMMDRNLGATITGVTGAISQPTTTDEAVKYYGLLYEWGRKDPFIGSNGKQEGNASGYSNFVPIYDGTTNASPSTGNAPFKTAGATTLANTVYNPGTFFNSSGGSANNWLLGTSDANLWGNSGTAKSVFDPCPPGWRVPCGDSNYPWSDFTTKTSTWKKSATGTGGRMYSGNGIQAWYPATGCFYFYSLVLYNVGTNGYYWSDSLYRGNTNDGYRLNLNSSSVSSGGNARSDGFSVRCIQE